jgi:uncharacterized protein YbjT (DUF2867 family)
MKKQILLPPEDPAEALLMALMADCQAIIRDNVLPGMAGADEHHYRRTYIHSVGQVMECAVHLSDAIGRLRGVMPAPEMRQRITVERIEPAQRLSPPKGEGG